MRHSFLPLAWSALLLVSAIAQAAALKNVRLQIDSHGEFARCIAEAALKQVITRVSPYESHRFEQFIGVGVDGVGGPYPSATLDFSANNPDGTLSEVFTIRMNAIAPDEWTLSTDSTGEITPVCSSVDSAASVIDLDTPMAVADISACAPPQSR